MTENSTSTALAVTKPTELKTKKADFTSAWRESLESTKKIYRLE